MTTVASEAATPSRCPATALAWAAGIAMIAASNGPLRCGPCSDSMASTHTSCSVRSTRVTVTSVRIVNPAARFLNSEDIPGVPTNHCEAGPDEAESVEPVATWNRDGSVIGFHSDAHPISDAPCRNAPNEAPRAVTNCAPWSNASPSRVRRVATRPPMPRLFSRTVTSTPASARREAADSPAGPAPITTARRSEDPTATSGGFIGKAYGVAIRGDSSRTPALPHPCDAVAELRESTWLRWSGSSVI